MSESTPLIQSEKIEVEVCRYSGEQAALNSADIESDSKLPNHNEKMSESIHKVIKTEPISNEDSPYSGEQVASTMDTEVATPSEVSENQIRNLRMEMEGTESILKMWGLNMDSIFNIHNKDPEDNHDTESSMEMSSNYNEYNLPIGCVSMMTTSHDQNETSYFINTDVNDTGKKRKRINIKKIRQERRSKGLSYPAYNCERIVPGRKIQPVACQNMKCQNKCCYNFSEFERQTLFNAFWDLDQVKKRCFLINCMEECAIKRRYVKTGNPRKQRNVGFHYYLPKDGTRFRVCQQFILKTLNITQKLIQYTYAKKTNINRSQPDKRGRKTPKVPETLTSRVVEFVEMLPAVPSLYNRETSQKKYLPSDCKNITNVYRMYRAHEESLSREFVKIKMFKEIFRRTSNIGVHIPKKEKCVMCENHKTVPSAAYDDLYIDHLTDMNNTKSVFENDQGREKDDPSFLCVSFDLQKVLDTPHGDDILLQYSRKYSMYNFTCYESGSRRGHCYLWGEIDGNRGPHEISSILYKYLQEIDDNATKKIVALYCDGCPVQNKNRQVLSMLYYFINSAKNIKIITLNFLLPGHTNMPVNSMHASIETNYKKKTIWAPSEWPTILTNSRVIPGPFIVNVLNFESFDNWSPTQEYIFPMNAKDENGVNISVRDIRRAVFKKGTSIDIFNTFLETEKKKIFHIKSKRGCFQTDRCPVPSPLYSKPLSISPAKYKNLMELCEKSVIPDRYHSEYTEMSNSDQVPDILSQTDEEDNLD